MEWVRVLVAIADVEHDGDIDAAVSQIIRSGGRVAEVSWGRIEHTTAYAQALVPEPIVGAFREELREAGYWSTVIADDAR